VEHLEVGHRLEAGVRGQDLHSFFIGGHGIGTCFKSQTFEDFHANDATEVRNHIVDFVLRKSKLGRRPCDTSAGNDPERGTDQISRGC